MVSNGKHLLNAFIEVIPHHLQRYDTAGDWRSLSKGLMHFKISQMENPVYEHALCIHEQLEAFWCTMNGVTQEQVDQWDFYHEDSEDPGSIPECPYYGGHMWGTYVEKQIIAKYGLDWETYDESFDKLEYKEVVK